MGSALKLQTDVWNTFFHYIYTLSLFFSFVTLNSFLVLPSSLLITSYYIITLLLWLEA